METNEIFIISGIFLLLLIVFKYSKKIIYLTFVLSLSVLAFSLISGCANGNLTSADIETVGENTLTRVSDIPFLQNSKIHIEESIILGEGESWTGQLFITVKENKRDVFNFYAKNLGDYGWKEQTTIRGNTSILNYIGNENRVAIITVSESGLFDNTTVLISVSPFTEAFTEKVGDYINEKYLEITD